jgi:hypothetical protein
MEERRVYEEIRALVESKGGKMHHQREGYQWGAWIIELNGKSTPLLSNGSGYPDLDRLYLPKSDAIDLNDWRNYTTILIPDAGEKLLQILSQK